MKNLVLTLGLCLVASVSFGQKKAVTEALKLAKDAKPNFTEARSTIKGALSNPETKNDAKTWYTAGQIESLQFDQENTKQMLGQQPNEEVMFNALIEVYPYFIEAYKLDNLPDAKGKVKPKFTKDIKSILRVNLPYYMNGGAFYFEKRDYRKAIAYFDQIVDISNDPIMKEGEKNMIDFAADSNYLFANYYAAIASAQLEDHEVALRVMNRALGVDFKKNDILQLLSEEYNRVNDTVNWEKTSNEGFALYPADDFFLFNLIRIYIDTDRHDKSLEYINTAISNNPTNAQLYNVAGRIHEASTKDYSKAEEYYIKSIEINSEDAEVQSNLGRIYFNQAVTMLDEANNIADVKKYNEEKEKAKDIFRKALPFFEKAFQLDPDPSDNKVALRSIYYNLDMGDKYEEMEKILTGGN